MLRSLALLVAITLTTLTAIEPVRARGTSDLVGVAGNRYESPTWGYALAWDDAHWTPVRATSADGVDLLFLQSRRSNLLLQSGPFRGDPEDCLADVVDALSTEPGVDDWEPLESEDGEPIAGDGPGHAWAAFSLTFTSETGDEFADVDYLECRTLVEEEAALIIFHNTLAAHFPGEIAAVAEVLMTLAAATDGGEPVPAEGKHAQVVAGMTPTSERPDSGKHGQAGERTTPTGERPEDCDVIAPWFAEVRPIVVRADELLHAGSTDSAAYAALAAELRRIDPAPGTAEFHGELVRVLTELAEGYAILNDMIALTEVQIEVEKPATGWALDFADVHAFLDERIDDFYWMVDFGDDFAAACGFAAGWLAAGDGVGAATR